MSGTRAFIEGDVQQVADLVWKVLHEQKGPSPASLSAYFNEVFLHNPWMDEGICSRVYEDSQGKLVGFFGAVPRRMSIQGKTIRLAFGSNFVVDPESRVSMAAVQLVKAFMKGTQDVSITDSANENSRKLLRSLGFHVVPIYSLLWARPLRPFRYALQGVTRLKKSGVIASIGTLLRPVSAVVDLVAARTPLSPFRQLPLSTTGEELGIDTLLQCLNTIPSKHWLLPEYDQDSLTWLVDFVARRGVLGAVRKIVVRDASRKIIGWYIYCESPGGIGEVLQVGADSPSVNKVLDHLFYDAWKRGLIGLHGRLEPQFMQELTTKACFFLRNGSWTLAHTTRPELLGLLQSGTAFFSRLDGEWSLR